MTTRHPTTRRRNRPRRRAPRNRSRSLATDILFVIGLAATLVVLAVAVFRYFPLRRQSDESPRTAAFTCPSTTLAAQAESSDLILTGSVLAVIPGDPYAQVLVTPIRVYRGSLPTSGLTILANPTDANSNAGGQGDLHFTSHDPPYLLFLRPSSDSAFMTSRCNGSRRLGSGLTAEETAVLGTGAAAPTL